MSIIHIICIFFLIQLVGCAADYNGSERLFLNKDWKFKTVDSLQFADPTYNDTSWSPIKIATPWSTQGYDYVGFAWYRIKVNIPSTLRGNSDSLKIFLGEIEDSHQLFINGLIVGENDSIVSITHTNDSAFSRKIVSKGKKYKYVIPVNDQRIKWDEDNLIAIRVFNARSRTGMITGIPYISPVSLENYINFDTRTFYKPDSTGVVDTAVIMVNRFTKPIIGNLEVKGESIETGKNVLKTNLSISLKPGEAKSIPISLPFNMDQTKIYFRFREHSTTEIVVDTVIVPFVLVRELKEIKIDDSASL